MSEMLLLGAGASVEAKVPDAKRMAKEIIKKFNDEKPKEAELVNYINERLIKNEQLIKNDSTIDCVDVEALYNAILLLSERKQLELSPFVESWDSYIESIDPTDNILGQIAFSMNSWLDELTLIKEKSGINYLEPILNLVNQQNRLAIATLNYDNAIELLAQLNSVSCETGIETWNEKGIFDFSGNGLKLIKVHGSNYWYWTGEMTTYEKRLLHRQIRYKTNLEDKLRFRVAAETPMVIFGQRNKLTAEGPFLDLLRNFQNELEKSNILTVIGYSLRDKHINTYISKWLNESADNKIRIVDPNFEKSDVVYVRDLLRLRSSRPNQVEAIEKFTGDALVELYGEKKS